MNKLLLLFFCLPLFAVAQEDLLKELEQDSNTTQQAFATFKGTRLVNGHTIETKAKGSLEFIFQHRFGPVNGGLYEMFGLDEAYVRLGLDYGITDNLSVSAGRNSVDKTLDGFVKYKVLHQQKGEKNFPFSITLLEGVAYKLSPKDNEEVSPDFENVDRLSYTSQLLIARKFNSNFSFQIMPSYIHTNAVDQSVTSNDQFALGMGARLKVSGSVALTAEYYYNFTKGEYYVAGTNGEKEPYYNALGFGVDIETGGHVFQLLITNGYGLTERAFITETKDNFFAGDIHFGFNVTRTFQLKENK